MGSRKRKGLPWLVWMAATLGVTLLLVVLVRTMSASPVSLSKTVKPGAAAEETASNEGAQSEAIETGAVVPAAEPVTADVAAPAAEPVAADMPALAAEPVSADVAAPAAEPVAADVAAPAADVPALAAEPTATPAPHEILENPLSMSDSTAVAVHGDGVTFETERTDLAELVQWRNVAAVSAGSTHVLGLTRDGTVLGAGENRSGCLDCVGMTGIRQAVAGAMMSALVTDGGKILLYGPFGDASVPLMEAEDVDQVAFSATYAAVLYRDGSAAAYPIYADEPPVDLSGWRDMTRLVVLPNAVMGWDASGRMYQADGSGASECARRSRDAANAGYCRVYLEEDGSIAFDPATYANVAAQANPRLREAGFSAVSASSEGIAGLLNGELITLWWEED